MRNKEKSAPEDALDIVSEADADEQPEADNAAPDPGELATMLEDARSKADENWNQCLRLQAEIDNLRKRNERDLANAHKFALEKFAAELLPVKDSLELGLAAAADQNADVEKLKEGSALTLKMLSSVMERFNITEINPLNEQFNPEYHEAMSIQEREDVAPNTVVTVVQRGYLLNDRLIRPAMVIVSKAPAQSAGGRLDEKA
ncbi:MAG: nucleotide exchange factor GrpE [Thiogranum sp.]|nr:nucleotide exchange factor GrpE [Thiogranum sp.]